MQEAFIEIQSPEGPRRIKLEGKPITIGRQPGNVIVINDEQASRNHCVIEPAGASWVVKDLNSRNGTKLNDKRVAMAILKPGDVVRVGKWTVKYQGPKPPANVGDFPSPSSGGIPATPPAAFTDDEPLDLNAAESAPKRKPAVRSAGDIARTRPPTDTPPPALEDEALPTESVPLEPGYEQDEHESEGDAPIRRSDDFADLDAGVDLGDQSDPEHPLGELSNVDDSLQSADVALINARGETIHASGEETGAVKGKSGKRAPGDGSREGIRILRMLLLSCIQSRATDVHIEPKQNDYVARLRVDGMMVEAAHIDKQTASRLVGVVKILSDIDIAQRNTIQEGHFSARVDNRRIDYRISFTPSMYGQKLVIRVLDLANAPVHMSELHMPDWMLQTIRKTSKQDQGMILVSGPTGSGKTTTLYSILRDIDVQQRNVITIEDPVEYQISGVTQIPVNEQQGNDFKTLLRSILRQDPDVILLGEVRDKETAQTAMQASMTGHLVLSTVHAKDTIGSMFRLLDLGIESYLVASALNIILAQRLVRVLCPDCKEAKRPTPQQTMRMGRSVEGIREIYVPVGCAKCLNTGYNGRRGIYEMLAMSDELRDVVLKSPTIQAIKEETNLTGFMTLRQSGFKLVAEGATSMEEVDRVTGVD